jgi:dTDP-4-dehydrorhamnose reductase
MEKWKDGKMERLNMSNWRLSFHHSIFPSFHTSTFMQTATILITGSAGFLGYNFARYFRTAGKEVVGLWHRKEPDRGVVSRRIQADLAAADMDALLGEAEAGIVVHCAALSARRDCEADPALARAVNVEATQRLAEAAARHGARFVFISTDLVFDGDNAPYREDDPPSPISLYGETKAMAEKAVLAVNPESCIIRTALMYGRTADGAPGSFLAWTLAALKKDEALRLYTNQFRAPLYAPDVPRFIDLLLTNAAAPGIYHAAGPHRLSRHEIGLQIAQAFNLSPARIIPTEVERPAGHDPLDDCTLSTTKAEALGMHFTGFAEGLSLL